MASIPLVIFIFSLLVISYVGTTSFGSVQTQLYFRQVQTYHRVIYGHPLRVSPPASASPRPVSTHADCLTFSQAAIFRNSYSISLSLCLAVWSFCHLKIPSCSPTDFPSTLNTWGWLWFIDIIKLKFLIIFFLCYLSISFQNLIISCIFCPKNTEDGHAENGRTFC